MNHNFTHFNNSLDNYYENIQKHKNEIFEEIYKDKDSKYFNLLNQKLTLLESILKSILKYKTLNNKIKTLEEKEKYNNLLSKKI